MVLLGVFLFTAWPREAACAPIGACMPAPGVPATLATLAICAGYGAWRLGG